jgi:hypothetical protein
VLTYTWDFDKRSDADGDGFDANDVQAEGHTVSWTFTESGAIWVVVTVQNDAGLNKSVDHLIEVEGVVTTQTGSNVPFAAKIGVALIIFVLLGAGGWFLLNRRQNLLEEATLAAQHAAAQEEEVAEPEPTDVEQIAMFDTRSAALTGRAGAAEEIAALAGVDPGAGQMLSDDALSAFSDMSDEPVAAAPVDEHDPILDDLDFLRTRDDEKEKPEAEPDTTATPVAESAAPAKKEGAGAVQLPDSITIASPPPADAQPVTTPEPAPEVQASTPTVRTACPACNQQFAVEMPPEISEAMVACPKCEQRIKLQR